MALKPIMHEVCQKCGEVQAHEVDDYISYAHHCKFAPPGPPDPPRRMRKKDVVFIKAEG